MLYGAVQGRAEFPLKRRAGQSLAQNKTVRRGFKAEAVVDVPGGGGVDGHDFRHRSGLQLFQV